ncbi:PREDICTED: uncharacterized protein LOC105453899 [Wasmannia auropunctata]|uniref:uncharacterized protein LOC105453899 n=1 Tax=Wasmannia auropunctata TaxID=64793 RepID=UPI0005EEF41D|nr:PREDICTED: uncharacterized protein LOC105453899 [Wasmannia auropunctata]
MEQKSTKLSYKKVISGVKLSLWIVWTWPMPKDTARFKIVCMKLYHCLCVILAIGLEVPIIYAIVNNIDDFSFFIDLILQQSPIVHAIFNFIFYNTNYHHIQNVVSNMEHFCNSMKSREEVVIQRYVDKCVTFYGVISVIFYVLSGIFCIVPLILHQPFPIVFEYPFDVYHQPLRVIIYAHQGIVAFIVSGQLCLNAFAACLLWFASARFEMLIEDLKNFTNIHQLTVCVKKHQEILA